MKNPTNGELKIMLGNIHDNVKDGFKGVHKRQDTANHGILKNTEFRLKTTGALNVFKAIGIANFLVVVGLVVDKFFN